MKVEGDRNGVVKGKEKMEKEGTNEEQAKEHINTSTTLPCHAHTMLNTTNDITMSPAHIPTVSNCATAPTPLSFNWAEDINMTITPTPVALVAPATCAPCDFSVLHSSTWNPWGSLNQHHHRFQPCICNSSNSGKYNTNYAFKPTEPSPASAPVQLIKTI